MVRFQHIFRRTSADMRLRSVRWSKLPWGVLLTLPLGVIALVEGFLLISTARALATQPPIEASTQPVVCEPEATFTEDLFDTSRWDTYTDDTLGFSIKVPPGAMTDAWIRNGDPDERFWRDIIGNFEFRPDRGGSSVLLDMRVMDSPLPFDEFADAVSGDPSTPWTKLSIGIGESDAVFKVMNHGPGRSITDGSLTEVVLVRTKGRYYNFIAHFLNTDPATAMKDIALWHIALMTFDGRPRQ